MMLEQELAMAERHIALGEAHLCRQHEIIDWQRRLGLDSEASEALLQTFELMLALHYEHLAHLLDIRAETLRRPS